MPSFGGASFSIVGQQKVYNATSPDNQSIKEIKKEILILQDELKKLKKLGNFLKIAEVNKKIDLLQLKLKQIKPDTDSIDQIKKELTNLNLDKSKFQSSKFLIFTSISFSFI